MKTTYYENNLKSYDTLGYDLYDYVKDGNYIIPEIQNLINKWREDKIDYKFKGITISIIIKGIIREAKKNNNYNRKDFKIMYCKGEFTYGSKDYIGLPGSLSIIVHE